jgi:hypothetical protein
MTTSTNYTEIQALAKFDLEDLLEDDSFICLYNSLKSTTNDATNLGTPEQFAGYLAQNNFYIPSILAYNGNLGFFVTNGFINIDKAVELGGQIPSLKLTDPVKHSVTFGGEEFQTVTIIKFKANSTIKTVSKLDNVFDDANAYDEKAAAAVIAALEPEPLSNIPEGTYKITGVAPGEKRTILSAGDLRIVVNKATPESIGEVTSKDGAVYASVDGKIKRGISVTGGSERLVVVGEEEEALGKTYKVIASVTTNAGNSDYYISKLAPVVDGVVTGIPKWYITDASVNAVFLNKLNKGQSLAVAVSKVQKISGNMRYPRPEFEVVAI